MEYILWTINSQPTICYDYDKRMEKYGDKINNNGEDLKVRDENELKNTLNNRGFNFNYTNEEKSDSTVNKKMDINEFLNG